MNRSLRQLASSQKACLLSAITLPSFATIISCPSATGSKATPCLARIVLLPLVDFLEIWWESHILNEDRRYAEYIDEGLYPDHSLCVEVG